MALQHQRAHSKFSASGAIRWMSCPGSVELSEAIPDKSSIWAEEGTKAHEVFERFLLELISTPQIRLPKPSGEMFVHGSNAATFVMELKQKQHPDAEVFVEDRIYLDFIHPEMFGTFDAVIVDHWGTLHVFDYKYGAGHAVSPTNNLQMIFYGLGLAHKYHWNFKNVRLWIIQPRIKGYDGPLFWDISLVDLKKYTETFKKAVDRVLKANGRQGDFKEGSWCHWCKAKSKCPLKEKNKLDEAKSLFTLAPLRG